MRAFLLVTVGVLFGISPNGRAESETPDPKEIITRFFHTGPVHMSVDFLLEKEDLKDLFQTTQRNLNGDEKSGRTTAKSILMDTGIEFGPGADAHMLKILPILVVKNTREQMELVDDYFQEINGSGSIQIIVTTQLVEVDATTYHAWKTASANHLGTPKIEQMVDRWLEEKSAKLSTLGCVPGRSGQRFISTSFRSVPLADGVDDENGKGKGDFLIKTVEAGFHLDCEAIIDSDGEAIDANIQVIDSRLIEREKGDLPSVFRAPIIEKNILSNELTILVGNMQKAGTLQLKDDRLLLVLYRVDLDHVELKGRPIDFKKSEISTVSYRFPISPFAKGRTAQDSLEGVGVDFSTEGSFARYKDGVLELSLTTEQHRAVYPLIKAARRTDSTIERFIPFAYERIDVPKEKLSKLISLGELRSFSSQLYPIVRSWVDEGNGTVTAYAEVSTETGNRGMIKTGREFHQIDKIRLVGSDGGSALQVVPSYGAESLHELSIEFDPVIFHNHEGIDLNLSITCTEPIQGEETDELYIRKLQVQSTAKAGVWTFVGTTYPQPVDGKANDMVSLNFVNASVTEEPWVIE